MTFIHSEKQNSLNAEEDFIKINNVKIYYRKIGQGPPLLLLHGYPQTHYMWHKVEPYFIKNFTVISTDLRGYGDSDKPLGNSNHSNYSKRTMAKDQISVMQQLGYEKFYLVGHDRGARVAHRLALDFPKAIIKLVLLDIAPTNTMYAKTDQDFATAYYHWFFLIQPYPLPEQLILGAPEYFLSHCLNAWSSDISQISKKAINEYLRCFCQKETIHGTCEDYRASATIDIVDDQDDSENKITSPLLVMWGNQGIIGKKYNVLEIWQSRANNVYTQSINCGHFLPEESPIQTYNAIFQFFNHS